MSSPRLLVADDEPLVRELLEVLLEMRGYRVSTAADGVEALAAVRADPPDVMLLDLNMPRLDGFGVLEALRDDPPPTMPKVIMLTARNDPSDMDRCLSLGAADFLLKPFQNAVLLKRISGLIRPPGGGREGGGTE